MRLRPPPGAGEAPRPRLRRAIRRQPVEGPHRQEVTLELRPLAPPPPGPSFRACKIPCHLQGASHVWPPWVPTAPRPRHGRGEQARACPVPAAQGPAPKPGLVRSSSRRQDVRERPCGAVKPVLVRTAPERGGIRCSP